MPKQRHRAKTRRTVRQRTAVALAGSALAVLPTLTTTAIPTPLAAPLTNQAESLPPTTPRPPSPDITPPTIAVDGSLPQPPLPTPLTAPGAHASYGSYAPGGALAIPDSMLKAYKNAANILAREQPDCHLDWALIASIGRIESNHARGGYVTPNGDTLEPILGPILNGNGYATIPDTDNGRYDGNTHWDRAVGPTQFIPSTWKNYASDGNNDGISNPSNIYDATLATARYLCTDNLNLTTTPNQRTAIYRYNHSQTYVDTVINWANAYRNGVNTLPDSTIPIGAP
ncbi:lytic transglycosylase domain-containing protein, partial [Amycolatopsis sp. H20-H5]|uniref:lytic transglycosylase domain-containing protein n=1 Tax=Amycolatopsis sp. H20-H5 TaxID=3046309 RepID=UPI002DBCAFBC